MVFVVGSASGQPSELLVGESTSHVLSVRIGDAPPFLVLATKRGALTAETRARVAYVFPGSVLAGTEILSSRHSQVWRFIRA